VQGWKHHEKADKFAVDVELDAAHAENYDALLLPGGVLNPDQLRVNPKAVEFVKSFFQEGKPVAAICHGPRMLVEADVVQGRAVTSWPSVKTDLRNAGAQWLDMEVGLITDWLPAGSPTTSHRASHTSGIRPNPASAARRTRL
jgi:protease I